MRGILFISYWSLEFFEYDVCTYRYKFLCYIYLKYKIIFSNYDRVVYLMLKHKKKQIKHKIFNWNKI
jgi:hypothetical protein